MNDDDLKALFGNSADVKPSDTARARAKSAAVAAFDAADTGSTSDAIKNNSNNAQGNVTSLRPTTDNNQSVRRRVMNSVNQRWVVSGVASAAVLVLTVSVLMNVSDQQVIPQSPRKIAKVDDDSMLGLEEVVVSANRQEEALSVDVASISVSEPALEPLRQSEYRGNVRSESDMAMADASAPAQEEVFAGASENSRRELPKKESNALYSIPQLAPQSVVQSMPVPQPGDLVPPGYYQDEGRDKFENIEPSPIKLVSKEPVSTFSVDVDTASYSFVRRQLNQGVLPQKDAVRVEEMINYFDYDYPLPENKNTPFKSTVAVTDAPWKAGNKLIHIGIRGYDIPRQELPASNLVFLLDVSGSMNSPDKLPLVKQSMGLLLTQLNPTDTVAIVAYAGAAGTVLEPTQAKDKQQIMAALERLSAGGSTAGGQGIQLAYQLAKTSFNKKAVNRVILATDGDFNVGITDREELKSFVERQRDAGIFLSVLGFGQGNYNDHMMQVLAQNGNGVAAYIDTLSEAQKVLVNEATSTLFPIAKDVKIQMEFNPQTVSEYRLLGYETRALKQEDFNNDKVDAGDIGAGHRVTAIYEITPVGASSGLIDPSRYVTDTKAVADHSNEYGFLKIRYKLPEESTSTLITTPVDSENSESAGNPILSRETDFATAVAGFAELLRGGEYADSWTYKDVIDLANKNKGDDLYGYRAEFVQLARKASVAQAMR